MEEIQSHLNRLKGKNFMPSHYLPANTKGGLKTNAEHQVMGWDNKPIKGLYAAGEIACGLNRGGAMLTDALVFGQVVGKEVAQQ
ncbi:hypothetical protein TURTL08_17290 [Turicimonas sp. TL08]